MRCYQEDVKRTTAAAVPEDYPRPASGKLRGNDFELVRKVSFVS
jgi:hypothetical protein